MAGFERSRGAERPSPFDGEVRGDAPSPLRPVPAGDAADNLPSSVREECACQVPFLLAYGTLTMSDATPGASEPAPGTTGAETHEKREAGDDAEGGAQSDGVRDGEREGEHDGERDGERDALRALAERDVERDAASGEGDDAMRVGGWEDVEGDPSQDKDDDSFGCDDDSLLEELHPGRAGREVLASSRKGGSKKRKTTTSGKRRASRSRKPAVLSRSNKAGAQARGAKGRGGIDDYFDSKESDPAKNGSRGAKGPGWKAGDRPRNGGRGTGKVHHVPLAGPQRTGGIHFAEERDSEEPKTDANPPSAAAAGTARGNAGAQGSSAFNEKNVATARKRMRSYDDLSGSEQYDSETNDDDAVEDVVLERPPKKGRRAEGVAQRRRAAGANEQASRATRAPRATPARRAEEGVRPADAEPSDLVAKVNAMQRRIEELERDKLRDNELDTLKNKNMELMECELKDYRAKVAGFEAERAANLAMNQSTITKQMMSQKGSKTPSGVRKEARAVKHASTKYEEAAERARLPPLQQRVLGLCEKNVIPFCKLLVRQLDIEECMVEDDKRVHAWVPEPLPLNAVAADAKGCNTPGLGPLTRADESPQLAPAPPMLSAIHKAMSGGLFGLRDGADNGRHLLRLARIVCKDRASLDAVDLDISPSKEQLPSGRAASVLAASVRATSLSDDEMRAQCEEVCNVVGATKDLKSRIGKRISDEASAHKSHVAVHYLQALGFRALRGKFRTAGDIEETAEVVTNFYSFGLPTAQLHKLCPAQLMTIARRHIAPEMLNGWRVQPYDKVCLDPKDKASRKHKAFEKNKDEVDIFFGNAVARSTYREWTTVKDVCDATPCTVPELPGDASVLTLARLDAWMATNVLMSLLALPDETGRKRSDSAANDDDVKVTNTMGKVRNTTHNDMFEILLPRAIEGVLGEIRAKVEEAEPDELWMPFDWKRAKELEAEPRALNELTSSKTTVFGDKGHRGDLHSQAWRTITSSHLNPFDDRHYVVALPSFISTHVCSWIGEVKDAFIGVSDGELEYVPITSENNSLLVSMPNTPEDEAADPEDEPKSGAKGGGGATCKSPRRSPRKKRGNTQEDVRQSQEDSGGEK